MPGKHGGGLVVTAATEGNKLDLTMSLQFVQMLMADKNRLKVVLLRK